MKFTCCVCHKVMQLGEPGSYTIQVSQPAAMSAQPKAELLWGHGVCLCKAIPVICEKIPS